MWQTGNDVRRRSLKRTGSNTSGLSRRTGRRSDESFVHSLHDGRLICSHSFSSSQLPPLFRTSRHQRSNMLLQHPRSSRMLVTNFRSKRPHPRLLLQAYGPNDGSRVTPDAVRVRSLRRLRLTTADVFRSRFVPASIFRFSLSDPGLMVVLRSVCPIE